MSRRAVGLLPVHRQWLPITGLVLKERRRGSNGMAVNRPAVVGVAPMIIMRAQQL